MTAAAASDSPPASIDDDRVQRWTVAALVALVPGTSRRTWLVELLPELTARGVVRKVGRAWLARRSAIETSILSDDITAARRRTRTR